MIQESRARNVLGSDLVALGEPDAGLAELRESRRLAGLAGTLDWLVVAHHNLALNLLLADHRAEAVEEAIAGRDLARRMGLERRYAPYLVGVGADALFRSGRWDEAVTLADETLAAVSGSQIRPVPRLGPGAPPRRTGRECRGGRAARGGGPARGRGPRPGPGGLRRARRRRGGAAGRAAGRCPRGRPERDARARGVRGRRIRDPPARAGRGGDRGAGRGRRGPSRSGAWPRSWPPAPRTSRHAPGSSRGAAPRRVPEPLPLGRRPRHRGRAGPPTSSRWLAAVAGADEAGLLAPAAAAGSATPRRCSSRAVRESRAETAIREARDAATRLGACRCSSGSSSSRDARGSRPATRLPTRRPCRPRRRQAR